MLFAFSRLKKDVRQMPLAYISYAGQLNLGMVGMSVAMLVSGYVQSQVERAMVSVEAG